MDPRNFNVSVRSAGELAERANVVLAAEFAKRFTLAVDDARFFDFGVAIRNYLGHRSKASRAALKAAVVPLAGPNADLGGALPTIGAYLKLRNGTGDTRSIVIANRFIDLARVLS